MLKQPIKIGFQIMVINYFTKQDVGERQAQELVNL